MDFSGKIEFTMIGVADLAEAQDALDAAMVLLFDAGSGEGSCRSDLDPLDAEAEVALTAGGCGPGRSSRLGRLRSSD